MNDQFLHKVEFDGRSWCASFEYLTRGLTSSTTAVRVGFISERAACAWLDKAAARFGFVHTHDAM
jgi:hypothetical protein